MRKKQKKKESTEILKIILNMAKFTGDIFKDNPRKAHPQDTLFWELE